MNLRDYQIDIANKARYLISTYGIAYLCMQTRTGKTLTAFHVVNLIGSKKVLFICKKKIIPSIKNDFEKSGYKYALTIINYDGINKIKNDFDFIIIDESHSIGAFPKPSLRTKRIKEICKGLPIIYLSATPSPESYSQLYHQFWVSDFSPLIEYTNFYKFAKKFVTIKKKRVYGREINDYSECDKTKLMSKIRHLFLSYTQEDAGFLVEVKDKVLIVPMPDNILNMIKIINRDSVYTLDGYDIIADTAVKKMNKTHQLSSGTVIDEDGYRIVSTFKVDFLKKYFENKKIAIFYKYKSEYAMLRECYPDATDVAEDFQAGLSTIFLGQFVSSREGVRLDTADAVVFFNLDYSYLSYEQARNRIASFDRTDTATLYLLFSDNGLEKHIYNRVKNKKKYTLSYYNNERNYI